MNTLKYKKVMCRTKTNVEILTLPVQSIRILSNFDRINNYQAKTCRNAGEIGKLRGGN